MRYFSKKKKKYRQALGDPPSILISKILGDFSSLSLCDFAPSLHLVWRRHWSNL